MTRTSSSLSLLVFALFALPSHADATCPTEVIEFSATASTPSTAVGTRTTSGLVFTDGSYRYVNSFKAESTGEIVALTDGTLGLQDPMNDTISTELTFTRTDKKNFSVASVTALDRNQGADGPVIGGYQGFGVRLRCYNENTKSWASLDTPNKWKATPTTLQDPLPGAECTRLIVNVAAHTGSAVDMVLTGLSFREAGCPASVEYKPFDANNNYCVASPSAYGSMKVWVYSNENGCLSLKGYPTSLASWLTCRNDRWATATPSATLAEANAADAVCSAGDATTCGSLGGSGYVCQKAQFSP